MSEQLTLGAPMEKSEIAQVPLNKIKVSRNSRISIHEEELSGLMQSIKSTGLLQPIGLIRRGNAFEIAYGNRRFLACSKLGYTSIPAVIRDEVKEFDMDIQNLTENIQRRNLGLAEVGRYIELLKKEGLSNAEAAVRLGVDKDYVRSCVSTFKLIPENYRQDIEVRLTPESKGKPAKPGKISMAVAQAVLSSQKTLRLSPEQMEQTFRAIKVRDSVTPHVAKGIAFAIKDGKDPETIDFDAKRATVNFTIAKKEMERLKHKHIENGPFGSLNAVFLAILSGKVSDRVKLLNAARTKESTARIRREQALKMSEARWNKNK